MTKSWTKKPLELARYLIHPICIIIPIMGILVLYNNYPHLVNPMRKVTNLEQVIYEDSSTQNKIGADRVAVTECSKYGNVNSSKMACILPKLNPFDPVMMRYITESMISFDCTAKHPKIFTTDLESNLIQLTNPAKFGYSSCCYQNFSRVPGHQDTNISLDKTCIPIIERKTPIPKTMDFIMVSCNKSQLNKNSTFVHFDAFGLVHLKPEVEQRIANGEELWSPSGLRLSTRINGENAKSHVAFDKEERRKDLNVVIFGLDSVSHMNFIRTMPLTFEYITKNLSAYGLNGYVQVGFNTFENLIPLFSGLTTDEFLNLPSCFENGSLPYDECPFIWKNYSNRGYRTAFGEDAVHWSIFNYQKPGFLLPPTDYYYHHLSYQLSHVLTQEEDDTINKISCNGPRFSHQLLLDLLMKMAFTAGTRRKFFQLFWSTALTHYYLSGGKLEDESLFETLKWLKGGGYLENMLFILMSDHGLMRSSIWKTPPPGRAKVENRLPFLFLMFPEWFQKEHPSAFQNLKENENRLTTHFDLHETLLDILKLEKLDDVEKRAGNLSTKLPRGISLFLPIPKRRTCKDAGIESQWCICSPSRLISAKNNSLIQDGANRAVFQINDLIRPYPQCQILSLKNVSSAEIFVADVEEWETWETSDMIVEDLKNTLNNSTEATFRITFVVAPSDGLFEVTATHSGGGNWELSKDISRLNTYGDQSFCVQNYRVERFCYCIK